jgi:hypothetical protein
MLTSAPDLLHVVGYLTGAALYAMLLAMALRDRSGDRLTLGTAVIGLAWNLGELGVSVLRGLQWFGAAAVLAAASFGALGSSPHLSCTRSRASRARPVRGSARSPVD